VSLDQLDRRVFKDLLVLRVQLDLKGILVHRVFKDHPELQDPQVRRVHKDLLELLGQLDRRVLQAFKAFKEIRDHQE
jgi:hypothetical protein